MNFIEKILYTMKWKIPTPTNYGWFHLMFIGIMTALTLYLVIFQRKCRDKTMRIICFAAWLICFLFEIYKQLDLSFSYDAETGVVKWSYRWYAFPFQFCSSPLYILPFVAFLPQGKVRDAFIAYSSTFVLFAGLAVFVYPGGVWGSTLMIDIQTMIHHGLQIVIGVFLLAHEHEKINIMYYLGGCIVFAGMTAVAMALNMIVPCFLPEGTKFNMFYISPKFNSSLPILSIVQPKVPYAVFFIMYVIGFTACALVIDLVYMLVRFIMRKCAERKTPAQA